MVMVAQIVTFEESEDQLNAGVAHVMDDIVPALEAAQGLTGFWLVDREHGKRLSVLVWESDAAASAAMVRVQQRLASSKHTRPTPTKVERFEVFARTRNMMGSAAITRAVMTAIEAADWDRARSFLADDFRFSGPVPTPIDAAIWLGVHRALYDAMPDLRFNPSAFEETADGARFDVALTMTHTGTLTLPPLGINGYAATGRRVSLPPETATVTVLDGKVVSWTNVTPANGGLAGIAQQVGLELAAH
jgi:hypothetical protein